MKRMMEKEGVTEMLKAEESLEWVRRANEIKVRVEEKIINNLLQM